MTTLAVNVIRENLRNKVLYLLAGIGLLLLFAMLAGSGGKVTDGSGNNLLDSTEGLIRVGFALVGLLGSLVTVIVSMNTIPREFERQTIHLLLVRPLERWQIAGAFLMGNILTAWIFLLAMCLPLLAALQSRGADGLVPALLQAVPVLALSNALIAGVTTLCSTRMPGPAAAFMGLLCYGLGAFAPALHTMTLVSKSALAPLGRLALLAVPPTGSLSGEALRLFGAGGFDWRAPVAALLYLWAVAGLTAFGLYRREV
jgi:ABC-type transport system involved in multi-copper enzyme maturation permease subunit